MEKSPSPERGAASSEPKGSTISLSVLETEVLARQLDGLPGNTRRGTVFSYATHSDILIMLLSCISAIIAGALNPLLTVIYGQLVGTFQAFSNYYISGAELQSSLSRFTLYFVYLAIGEFVFIYLATVGFYYTGERIVRRLRLAYLEAIIRQNMAFFDILSIGEVTTRITSDMNLIHEGVTSKISLCLTAAATFIAAFVIAFAQYWKLALILTSAIVVMAATGTVGAVIAVGYTKQSLAFYRTGATIAEEAFGSIRHVTAFGIQEVLAQRHVSHVMSAEKASTKAGLAVAIMLGVMYGVPYLSYGLSFWQGSRFVVSGNISGEGVVTTTLAIVIGAFAVGRVAPSAQAFVASVASASSILEAISRKSTQDPLSPIGIKLADVKGDITVKGVSLVYPSRPHVMVLDNLDLHIPAGKRTAIVGSSGCGKSSIVGLIERFYEPIKGQILLDGHDIQSLSLRWMRHHISFVGQNPTLFSTTIFENIRYGLLNTSGERNEKDVQALVVAAAKSAKAHDFIMALPEAYETEVGEKGLQLSGGQRQRIAIARALIGNPRILLLDEATSALDVRSQREVQIALDTASQGRTTVVIAHQLSTIRNADNIVVMSKGCVVEQGQHDDLMARKGVYFGLVNKQEISQIQQADRESPEDTDDRDFTGDLSTEDQEDLWEEKEGSESKTQDGADDPTERVNSKLDRLTLQPSLWALIKLIRKLTHPETLVISVGLCCSVIAGLGTPVQSIFFANLVDALSLPPSSYSTLRQRSDFWSAMYLMLGLVGLLARSGQGACFSYASEKLTRRARDQSFRSLLHQDVSYFNAKEHSIGTLTAFLSTGTTHLNSLSGTILGSLLSFISTIGGGVILSLIVGWKLALVCSATIPIVAGCGWIRLKMLAVLDDQTRKTHEKSAAYASEAVGAIRTVASLSLERQILDRYGKILDSLASQSWRSILRASAFYAASQSCVFLCAGLGFWYGGTLIASREYTMVQFFICFAALISGSQSAGAIFSFAPDLSKAMNAGRDLQELFASQPTIDTRHPKGNRIENEDCKGQLELRNLSFYYPTRPDSLVLQNFSLSIRPGQYIALVGPSGCGKSTIISLLERFYDPTAGQILVDGQEISALNINDYRRLFALVSQEPTVYQGTIQENIVLGSAPGVSERAVIQACKEANIYDFIMSLPDGFATLVGSSGDLLSGGQKQRLAIARALLRNPRILLLDEATSALDSASEKLVQEALDAASGQRTIIAVAHRLSTIRNADLICVLDRGQLVESGTHAELMGRRQAYFEMVELQRLEEEASS